MEMNLDNLISKIKKEGVEEAERKSQEIISDAQRKADDIIAHADRETKNILQEAEHEAARIKKLSEESVRQSVRDVLLTLRQRITNLCDVILKRQIIHDLSPDFLKGIIIKLIENFRRDGILDIEILLKKEDKDSLEKAVLNSLTEEMRKGITFKVSPSVEHGFRIGEKDKNYYYDFTDEGIIEALRMYLNPKIIKILDAGNK